MDSGNQGAEARRINLADLLNDMAADICDNYCKFPEQYQGRECALEEERCKSCPLNIIG